jgi:hypothetical protein
MVDLTPEPGPLVTSRAPTPGVSPAEAAAPFNELANNLDKIGEAAGSVADNAAQQAGAKAVTRDDQGNLVVASAPIIGPASGVYARAAYSSYLAKATPDIEDGILQLRLANPNDIQAFQAAAAGFKSQMLAKIDDPLLRGPVEKIIDQNVGQNFRSAILTNDRVHLQNTATALQSRLSEINDQGASLARQNGVETPEYAQIVSERAGIYKELQGDPRFNYPPERVSQEMSANRDTDVVQAVVGHVVRDYQTRRNMGDAQAALQSAFWGQGSENLALSPQKRDAGVTEGLRALQRVTTEETAEVTQNREAVQSYAKNLQDAPGSFDLVTHNTMVAKAQSIGDYKSLADLDAARIMQPVWQSISGLTDAQKVVVQAQLSRGMVPIVPQQMNGLSGAPKQKAAYDFFVDKGWSPPQAAGIVGGLRGETAGLDPTQIHDGGIGIGIAGWNGQRRDALNQFAAANNASPTDLKTQLEFVNYELNGSEKVAGDKLRAAQTPEQAGQATLSYFRPANYDVPGAHPERAQYARSAFNAFSGGADGAPGALRPGQDIGSASNPYVQSLFWNTVNEQRKSLTGSVEKMADNIIDTAVNRRQAVTPDELHVFALGAAATGRTDLVPKVEQALQTFDQYQGVVGGAASPSVAALRSQIETVAASGTDPIARHMLNNLDQMIGAGQEAMQNHPFEQAAQRGWTPPAAPLDPAHPETIAPALAQRATLSARIGALNHTPPPPLIDKDEMPQLQTALQGQQAPAVLGSIAQTLKPDEMTTLLKEDAFRSSVTGMSRSGDPAKMNAAYSFMDTLQKQNPLEFEKQFQDGLKDLRAWQSNLSFYPPDEAAKRLMQSYDPAQVKGLSAADTVAKKALESVSADSVVSKFSTGFGPIGTGARAPVSDQAGIAKAALKADYDKNYTDGFAATGDATMADKFAMEKLNLRYAVSPTNGNRVMANAPERYYPQVGGSFDWMGKQLDDAVAKSVGVSAAGGAYDKNTPPGELYGTVAPGEEFGNETPGERRYGAQRALVSDQTTDRDIASGKPPSYQVIVQDTNGRWSALTGTPADGGNMVQRFRFDPTTPFAERAATMNARRASLPGPFEGPMP